MFVTDLRVVVGLIAARIWYIHRPVSQLAINERTLTTVANIIIESAAMFSVWLAVLLGLFVADDPASYLFLDAVRANYFAFHLLALLNKHL